MNAQILTVNPSEASHARAIVQLVDEYARSPAGGARGLSDHVKSNLAVELAKRPTCHVVLAFVNDEAAGLIIAFEGFSTFQCQPLLNLHDVIVSEKYRGQGLSTMLLAEMEAVARRLGCCKLTLEVLERNIIAQTAYRSFGFQSYQLDPVMGKALFWEKKLQ